MRHTVDTVAAVPSSLPPLSAHSAAEDSGRWRGSCRLVNPKAGEPSACPRGKTDPCPVTVWPRCEAKRARLNGERRR